MPFARVVTLAMQGCQEQDVFVHCILENELQRGYFYTQTCGAGSTMTSHISLLMFDYYLSFLNFSYWQHSKRLLWHS